MNTSLLEAALAHHAAGRRVIPTRPNKAPDCRAGWSRWFSKPQTETEVRELFKNGVHGLGLILYPASPIVIIDFDGPHAEEAWKTTRLDLNGAGRVLTPSGGIHFVFRNPG